jgi:hypothetical protein
VVQASVQRLTVVVSAGLCGAKYTERPAQILSSLTYPTVISLFCLWIAKFDYIIRSGAKTEESVITRASGRLWRPRGDAGRVVSTIERARKDAPALRAAVRQSNIVFPFFGSLPSPSQKDCCGSRCGTAHESRHYGFHRSPNPRSGHCDTQGSAATHR